MATDTGDRRDTERPYAAFGEAIRSIREREGLSRAEVADRLDISYSMLSNIESGRRRLSDALLAPLATTLQLAMNELRHLRDAGAPLRHGSLTRSNEVPLHTTPVPDILSTYELAPEYQELRNRAVHGPAEDSTTREALYSRLMMQAQEFKALVRATDPLSEFDSEARSDKLSLLLRDLRLLDSESLEKVHVFAKGMLAARSRRP